MAKYTAVAAQTVAAGQSAVFDTVNACTRRNIYHTDGTGTFALRGVTNQCFARYLVSFGANIGIPAGGTAGAISVALSVGGETVGSAVATVTPAAAGDLWHVSVSDLIDVPAGLAVTAAIRNISDQAITVQNANLIITREA